MAGIQTEIRNHRDEIEKLDHNDPRYWEGAYSYQPYPKALYRVTQPGQTEPEMRVVRSEHEHEKLGSAWSESPATAKEKFEALEADVARAAAESNFADRHMSASAKAERLAYERSTDEMVVTVPRKKPGPKPRPPVSAD